jgi:hypothetical protein
MIEGWRNKHIAKWNIGGCSSSMRRRTRDWRKPYCSAYLSSKQAVLGVTKVTAGEEEKAAKSSIRVSNAALKTVCYALK